MEDQEKPRFTNSQKQPLRALALLNPLLRIWVPSDTAASQEGGGCGENLKEPLNREVRTQMLPNSRVLLSLTAGTGIRKGIPDSSRLLVKEHTRFNVSERGERVEMNEHPTMLKSGRGSHPCSLKRHGK